MIRPTGTKPFVIYEQLQRGAAAILMLLVLIVGGIGLFVATQEPESSIKQQPESDYKLLKQAKRALIAYAAFQNNPNATANTRPGELLCPDKNNSGDYDGADSCGSNRCCTYRGWLPFATLDLPELRDSSGSRLWYAVSEAYQTFNQAPLNSAMAGALTLDGQEVVAVIIAPGRAIAGQINRQPVDTLGLNAVTEATKFLDYANSDGDSRIPDQASVSTYFTEANNPGANDLVIGITAQELWEVAVAWPLQQARTELRKYYTDAATLNTLPYAKDNTGNCGNPPALQTGLLPIPDIGCTGGTNALVNFPAWFTNNQWDQVIYYVVSNDCRPEGPGCTGAGGALLYDGQGQDAILISAGSLLLGTTCSAGSPYNQIRPGATVCDYLELNENTDGDFVFIKPPLGSFSNDVFLPIDFR